MTLDGGLTEFLVVGERTSLQRAVLEHDWSSTPLGDERGWSLTLRTAVGTMLNSQFGMCLMWGPQRVLLYNDAYAPILGQRHPGALGRLVPDVWSDVWSDIEGMVSDVYAGGAVHHRDLPLVMTRRGYDEETYFTFSYSPIMEPGGRVAGLLNTVAETTAQVLATRRLRTLQRLGGLPRSDFPHSADACAAALDVVADSRADIPFAAAYLLDGADGSVRLAASRGVAAERALAESSMPLHVDEVLRTGRARTATGLADTGPGLALPGGSPVGDAEVHTAVVLPLVVAGQTRPVGAVVLAASPHLPLDDEYCTFLTLVAGQIAAAVTDAQAVERERRRAAEAAEEVSTRARFYADIAVTLQRSFLGPTSLPDGFAVHYAPATATLEVGGDWYDVVDLPDGLTGVVVGDVVGRGLAAAAVMGQLRSAARALLLESRSPRQVLTALDRFADLVPGAVCSTVFCAVVDVSARALRYSSAGHLPALLASADGSVTQLGGAQGLPLAVAEGDRPEVVVALPPGSALLLYTDGLVERRTEPLDEGIGRAAAALAEGRGLDAARLAELLTARLLDGARDDDVAFLVYRAGV